jgi:hypothetical protein
MKINLPRPSPAMVVALAALVFSLGGNVVAYGLGRNSVHSSDIAPGAVKASDLGKFRLRVGKLLDRDTTAHDGAVASAFGRARCKRGEQLITGGWRQRSGSEAFVVSHVSGIEAGPVPSERAWAMKMNSDLGGAARQDFVVLAYCLGR